MAGLRVNLGTTWIFIGITLIFFADFGHPGEVISSRTPNGRKVTNEVFATLPPFPSPRYDEQEFDVTLVSQTSMDRFWMLPFLCSRWGGPISIAVLEDHAPDVPEGLCSRMQITSVPKTDVRDLSPARYPVNRLRNAAIATANTSHFFMTDIDIWPDVNAYMSLHLRYRREKERLNDPHNAIVFTAFNRKRFCSRGSCLQFAKHTPQTITELQSCVNGKACSPFDAKNPGGQSTTYSYYWESMRRPAEERNLEQIVCFISNRFEPYVMVRKSFILPKFDERFFGYGKNKVQWITHLRYIGFSFYMMPENFVIHVPHPVSAARIEWINEDKKAGDLKLEMDEVFNRFIDELKMEASRNDIKTHICAKNKGVE